MGKEAGRLTTINRPDTLAAARAALTSTSRIRQEWARDVIAALERGDVAAARRQQIPLEELPQQGERKAA